MTGTTLDNRLLITHRHEGHKPWSVPLEVHPPYRKAAKVRILG
jgi:hypothetical protein